MKVEGKQRKGRQLIKIKLMEAEGTEIKWKPFEGLFEPDVET